MWKIRRYRKGDETGILELMKTVLVDTLNFDRHEYMWINKNYWKWMFLENPADREMIWVAEDKGKIIAHYALVPIRTIINGRDALCAEAVNIVVHPDYWGHGIFTKLNEESLKNAAKKGIELLYVFPNKNSYPLFVSKLEWKEVLKLDQLFRVIDAGKLAKRHIKNPLISRTVASYVYLRQKMHGGNIPSDTKIKIRKIIKLDKGMHNSWEIFWKKTLREMEHGLITVRDAKYAEWRFLNKPKSCYTVYIAEKDKKMIGYIVLKTHSRGNTYQGTIIDILSLQREATDILIKTSIQHFNSLGADVMNFNAPKTSVYYKHFKNCGFISRHSKEIPKLLAYPLKRKSLPCLSGWFMTNSDRNDI